MKKGFTLIELLAVIVILAIIALIATPLVITVIDGAKKGAFKDSAYGIVKAGEIGYTQDVLDGTNKEVTFIYTDGVETSTATNKTLNYKGAKPQNGIVKVNDSGNVALSIHDGTYCAEKDYDESEITLSEKTMDECLEYNQTQNVNKPVLSSGMTPIKWNGTDWVNTTEDDPEWYSYTTTDKKWANVQTEDGSFWVWIPRYAYSITSGYHTSTAGTIEVKFLIDDTNTTSDGTDIASKPTYSGDSQTNYVAHPAFTFGTDEVLGIWIAKFEPSVADQTDLCYTSSSTTNCDKTTLVPKIIPNANSWRNINIGNSFDVALAMKDNTSTYGWNAAEVDTHLMKNSEWGSVAYLSQSNFGKQSEIWINPNSNYTTGCAGDAVDSDSATACNTYESTNGVQASTTGNVYGIYDISGGTWEYVSAYVDNGDSNLTTYGSSILSADNKYKNIYVVGATDTRQNNYEANASVFGDAVYETSSNGDGIDAWNGDYSRMPYSSLTWFGRGGYYSGGDRAGAFYFHYIVGYPYAYYSFRPVVIINE